MKTSKCEGCGRPIMWAWTPAGKRMPLNPYPIRAHLPGAYVISGDNCRPALPLLDHDAVLYMNHWATCPNAKDFTAKAGQHGK